MNYLMSYDYLVRDKTFQKVAKLQSDIKNHNRIVIRSRMKEIREQTFKKKEKNITDLRDCSNLLLKTDNSLRTYNSSFDYKEVDEVIHFDESSQCSGIKAERKGAFLNFSLQDSILSSGTDLSERERSVPIQSVKSSVDKPSRFPLLYKGRSKHI